MDALWKNTYLATFWVAVLFGAKTLEKLVDTGSADFASLLLMQGAIALFSLVMYVIYWQEERRVSRLTFLARRPSSRDFTYRRVE